MKTKEEVQKELEGMEALTKVYAASGDDVDRSAQDIMATLRWVLS